MQVCWGKLELNSAGHRPSRIKFDDPWFIFLLYIQGLNLVVTFVLYYIYNAEEIIANIYKTVGLIH